MKIPVIASLALLSILLAVACKTLRADGVLQTVTLSNYPNGWTPDEQIVVGDVSADSIDEFGRINFVGDLHGNYGAPAGIGIWSYLSGNLSSILAPGTLVPLDGQPTPFKSIVGVGTSTDGNTFFHGHLWSPTLGDTDGYWLVQNAELKKVFVKGDPIPASGDQWLTSSDWASQSTGGRLFFEGYTRLPNNGYIPNQDALWFADTDGIPRLVAISGSSAPGLAPDQLLNSFSSGPLILTSHGEAAFYATYIGTQRNGVGIWIRAANGNLQLAMGSNDTVTVNGQQVPVQLNPQNTALNNAGQLVFRGIVNVSSYSPYPTDTLWIQDPNGSRRMIAHTVAFSPPALPDIVLNGFDSDRFSPVTYLNDQGEVAFTATFYHPSLLPPPSQEIRLATASDVSSGQTLNGQGVFIDDHGDLKLAVQSGDLLPGADHPLVWAEPLALNNSGQLLVYGALVDIFSATPAEFGMWIRDPDGTFHFVLKSGDQIDVAPGPAVDLRTVAYIHTTGDTATPDSHAVFTDDGEVLLSIGFTDGTTGTFVYSHGVVPEPSTAAISFIALSLVVGRRHQRKYRITEPNDPNTPRRPGSGRTTSARADRICT